MTTLAMLNEMNRDYAVADDMHKSALIELLVDLYTVDVWDFEHLERLFDLERYEDVNRFYARRDMCVEHVLLRLRNECDLGEADIDALRADAMLRGDERSYHYVPMTNAEVYGW